MFMEASNDLVGSKLVLSSKRKDEALSQIKDRTTVSIHDFDNAPAYLLPLQNGVLDLRTLTLRVYSPDDMFTKKLAVSYDPEAKCERFDSFLSEVAEGNTEVETTKKCLRQLVGYCLWKGYEKQKIFFLVGGGSNGKGVYMKVIERLLGRDIVSSVGTSALTESPFEKAELFGKYANISSELTVGKLKDVDNLKALSGGDQIEAQKKYKNPFTFTNTAKIIIASNQPPNIKDTSIGWWRRVHLVRFLRQFKEAEQDTTLVAKMTTKEALSGVLNVAIKELKEWLNDDGSLKDKIHLANEMDVETLQTIYECLEDPAMAFIYDCCYKAEAGDSESIITKDALFKHYTTYCSARRLPTVSEKSFTMTLKEKVGWISETHTEIGGVDTRCWRDIKVDLKKVDELHNFR
jgi:putative DNA primase/helicase